MYTKLIAHFFLTSFVKYYICWNPEHYIISFIKTKIFNFINFSFSVR